MSKLEKVDNPTLGGRTSIPAIPGPVLIPLQLLDATHSKRQGMSVNLTELHLEYNRGERGIYTHRRGRQNCNGRRARLCCSENHQMRLELGGNAPSGDFALILKEATHGFLGQAR